jgi:hypothetical protein
MTTNNHPAHGPVSLDRLHQISEILSKAAAQSDGGNLGYAMADAVKVIDVAIAAFGAEPVAYLYSASFERGHVEGELTDAPGCDMPVYSATLAPVVPDEIQKLKDGRGFKYVKGGIHYSVNYANGWNQCRAAMLQAGNSPVSPGYWVACSWRMPEGMQTVITSNGFDIGQGWWDGEGWNSFDCHDVVPGKVTHWMPLPAAPQQEVK